MSAYNTYVGARYVPIFDGDWNNTKKYDPLTIVMHEGNSYTSKTYVPIGADITNNSYWALTGNYNAQVAQVMESVEEIRENRPYVTPEMFGAAGDGVTPDNEALNTCFQFAYENNLIVYGLNKYLVDDTTFTIYSFYGILVPGGVEVHNMHFILKDGARNCASILTCKFSTKPYLFKNCTFEMPAAGLSNTSPYDGGNNGVLFIDDLLFPTDFKRGFSNITFDDCDFKNIWTYGIWCTPVDCTLRIENCNFSGFTYPILPYATNTIIQYCKGTHIEGRNMGYALADDEIENFTSPTLHKSITIRDSAFTGGGIYKVHTHTMKDLVYDEVLIEHCSNSGYPESAPIKDFIVFAGLTDDDNCTVNSYKIINCWTENQITFISPDSGIEILNSKIGNTVGWYDSFSIKDSVFSQIGGTIKSLLYVDSCDPVPRSDGSLRSSSLHWTDDSDGTETVIINNITFKNVGSPNAPALCANLRFKNMFVNGFQTTGYREYTSFINNYGIRDLTLQTNVYAKGFTIPYEIGQYEHWFDSVKNIIVDAIAPAGAFNPIRYTKWKLNNIWFDS